MATQQRQNSRRSLFDAPWPRPNISVLGYAIYLAINATSLWGGVFPFFPDEFRTLEVTFSFVASQAASFLAMFLISMVSSYLGSRTYPLRLPLYGTFASFIGSALLIAALYLGDMQIVLVVLAGIFLGMGSASFALSWQRYFSSLSAIYGNSYLLLATAFGTVVFLVLYLVPIAVTVYLVPLVLVPLCGLCSILANRTIDFEQPLFEDTPRDNTRTYVQFMRDYWRSAVAIGSLGIASGLVRSVLLTNATLGNLIIVVSMIGSLLASVVLLWVWRRGTFALDMRTVFLVLFPLTAIGLLLFPFLGSMFSAISSGAVYTIFTFALLVMLLQCMQITRDRGINALFVFGFFGSIVYLMQDVGLTIGYAIDITTVFGSQSFAIVALTGMFILSMALYLVRGDVRLNPTLHAVEKVEFVGVPVRAQSGEGRAKGDGSAALSSSIAQAIRLAEGEEGSPQPDLDARCQSLRRRYQLTNRETEIMALFARGYSMPHIAEILVVSENTVRTHSKHLYNKLGIHKRQELIELLQDDENLTER